MTAKTTIRVGGVPEHFNLPWHLAIENGHFEKRGLDLQWDMCKGGTGEMTRKMREGELDVSILLTEGVVADIANGNPSKIIAQYIKTPLIWGIHSAVDNPINFVGEGFNKKIAISRFGSGSHLMPMVHAHEVGKKIEKDQFERVKNLDGAIESLKDQETDVFYWEKYTTKPLVDNGTFKRLGEYITPWPCFVIAATDDFIANKPDELREMLDVIFFASRQFMRMPNVPEIVAERQGQKPEDAEQWFYCTEWAVRPELSHKMVSNVAYTLLQTGILPVLPQIDKLYHWLY